MSETCIGERRKPVPLSDAARIGERLRERRRSLKLTQSELASMAGLSRPTVIRWENGELPKGIATSRLKRLEAVLQVPADWLFSHEAEPMPAFSYDGDGLKLTRAKARMESPPVLEASDLGRQAARFRRELGLTVTEVADACQQLSVTVNEWEQGMFRKRLTDKRLRAWERALRLAPGQLATPPASHPLVTDGRWRVVIDAGTVEVAIQRVAECIASRGRNLLQPWQPLSASVARDAVLLGHRYGIGGQRRPLTDLAASYGIVPDDAHQIIARLVEQASQFDFEIPVLYPFLLPVKQDMPPVIAVSDGCSRARLGANLRFRDAAAFVSEILGARSRQNPAANGTRAAGENCQRSPGEVDRRG